MEIAHCFGRGICRHQICIRIRSTHLECKLKGNMKKFLFYCFFTLLVQCLYGEDKLSLVKSSSDSLSIETVHESSTYNIVNYHYFTNGVQYKCITYQVLKCGEKKIQSVSCFSEGKEVGCSFYDDNERLLFKADSIGENTKFRGYALKHGFSRDLPFQCFCTDYDENGNIVSSVWMVYDEAIESDISCDIEETRKTYDQTSRGK